MSPAARAILILSILLALALAWIVYREAGLRAGISEPEHRAALAAIEARNTAEKADLIVRHRLETELLKARLDGAVAEAASAAALSRERLAARRRERVRVASGGPEPLRQAVLEEAEARPDEVSADTTHVWLARRAALAWLDKTLALQHDLALAPQTCAVKMAEREREIVPPLVSARQTAELHAVDLDGQLRIALAERDYARRRAAAGKGEVLQWSLISGAAGLVVGAVAGGLAVGYLRR